MSSKTIPTRASTVSMVTVVDQTNHSQSKSKTMKHLFNLHRKSVRIDYRNQLCSFATFATGCVVLLSLVIPYYVVQFINPGDVWDRYRLAYEQPRVHFDYRYLFLAEVDLAEAKNEIITCSSFEPYNELTEQRQECGVIKVSMVKLAKNMNKTKLTSLRSRPTIAMWMGRWTRWRSRLALICHRKQRGWSFTRFTTFWMWLSR